MFRSFITEGIRLCRFGDGDNTTLVYYNVPGASGGQQLPNGSWTGVHASCCMSGFLPGAGSCTAAGRQTWCSLPMFNDGARPQQQVDGSGVINELGFLRYP